MDKRTLIGIVLIVLVTFLMPYYLRWISGDQPPAPPPGERDTSVATEQPQIERKDTSRVVKETPKIPEQLKPEEPEPQPLTGQEFTNIQTDSVEKQIHLETRLIKASVSNHNGGKLTHWELKKYDYYLGGKVDLISQNDPEPFAKNGLDIELVDRDGKLIQLSDFNLFTDLPEDTTIVLDENNPSIELEYYLPVREGRIVKKYIFYYDAYSFDVILNFERYQNYIGNRWYSFNWENGLRATEENIKEDYSYARAYAYQNGELEDLDVSEEKEDSTPPGRETEWTAVRTKYFLASIIPKSTRDMTVTLSGYGVKEGDITAKIYTTSLTVNFPSTATSVHTDSFTVYLGPLEYDILKQYKVDMQTLVLNNGLYEKIFRPISLLILPAFKFLHSFIPNYGFVIILFSILIKLVLHPLTKKSYQSMSEMQYIQPKMTEIREKYKSDPQRMNREMMKLYKEHGVNPLGGCIPMLLQMPLLFALFIVFRSTIQLRGEPFLLWITDLSRPDTLALGFALPLVGSSIHVLPFFMGLTMIWQSKMTMTDPKQKFMIYFMPVFLIFIFYSLPSGLNLYYAIFNLLSMFQTRMIKKKMHPDNGKADSKSTKPAESAKKVSSGKSRGQKSGKRKGQR